MTNAGTAQFERDPTGEAFDMLGSRPTLRVFRYEAVVTSYPPATYQTPPAEYTEILPIKRCERHPCVLPSLRAADITADSGHTPTTKTYYT